MSRHTPDGAPARSVTYSGVRVMREDATFGDPTDLHVVDGALADHPAAAATRVDATGWWATPGLRDVHLHLACRSLAATFTSSPAVIGKR